MTARNNLRTKRRRRKRQEAWGMEALQREGVGRVLSGVRADGVTVAMARTFCPPSRMPRWWIREDGGPWRRYAPAGGWVRWSGSVGKSVVRYTSGGKPHVSPVFVYPGGPL